MFRLGSSWPSLTVSLHRHVYLHSFRITIPLFMPSIGLDPMRQKNFAVVMPSCSFPICHNPRTWILRPPWMNHPKTEVLGCLPPTTELPDNSSIRITSECLAIYSAQPWLPSASTTWTRFILQQGPFLLKSQKIQLFVCPLFLQSSILVNSFAWLPKSSGETHSLAPTYLQHSARQMPPSGTPPLLPALNILPSLPTIHPSVLFSHTLWELIWTSN